MCGIYSILEPEIDSEIFPLFFNKLKHRGPDNSFAEKVNDQITFGFHRLAIVGLDEISNQPFHINGCWLVANGEIFNFKNLQQANNFNYVSHSDCEIIIHMYKKYGIEEALKQLDGEFAFNLYDEEKGILFAARDHLGVRPLYRGKKNGKICAFGSESKSLTFCDEVDQFPPRHWWSSDKPDTFNSYFEFQKNISKAMSEEEAIEKVRELIFQSVEKRMMSDREIGCLLSGGLDSSLVAGITSTFYEDKKQLKTFSVGFEGSPDLKNAQIVADYIGSDHYSVQLSEKDFLDAIETVVYQLGSYDVTTVRASVGHYLISKWVSENTDVKVLLSGETADELAGGYLYLQNAPSDEAFHQESIRLLTDIHFFDMLRGDRSISAAGLEARIPFSDKELVQFYLGIPTKYRRVTKERMEKYIIRKAFENENLIPSEVLWRKKNGFSDGVSNKNRSWHEILRDYIDALISDEEFEREKGTFKFQPPLLKEGYYYRKIFTQTYKNLDGLTPYQWLPKWSGNIIDPSARELNIYEAD